MMGQLYLVWSNEHRMWWAPGHRGYVSIISQAGRYTRRQAEQICENANFAQFEGQEPNEVMVLAPEYAGLAE